MKKLLLLLFSIVFSFNSHGDEVELNFSLDSFCDKSPKAQLRGNLFYLPNSEKPYSGENLCVYLSNDQYHSRGIIEDGFMDGSWEYWHENGQKKKQSNYKDGLLIDETEYYYFENGQISIERNLKDDRLHGKQTAWYENGEIQGIANFKDGKLNGKLSEWYENGEIKITGSFKEGNGVYLGFNENGQKISEMNVKDGMAHGKFTEWSENGQIISEKVFDYGDCISENCDPWE